MSGKRIVGIFCVLLFLLTPALAWPPGVHAAGPAAKQVLTVLIELGLVDSFELCTYDMNSELELTLKSIRSNLSENEVKC